MYQFLANLPKDKCRDLIRYIEDRVGEQLLTAKETKEMVDDKQNVKTNRYDQMSGGNVDVYDLSMKML